MAGSYLCETCFDAMTNHVVDVRGFEEAVCDDCMGGPDPRARRGSLLQEMSEDHINRAALMAYCLERLEAWSAICEARSTGDRAGTVMREKRWRKRMGVEPTIAGISRDHWI